MNYGQRKKQRYCPDDIVRTVCGSIDRRVISQFYDSELGVDVVRCEALEGGTAGQICNIRIFNIIPSPSKPKHSAYNIRLRPAKQIFELGEDGIGLEFENGEKVILSRKLIEKFGR